MFEALARFAIRFRWLIVVAWVALVAGAVFALPSLSSVTQSNNAQFLSADAPSRHAADLAAPFQGASPGATAIIVASRADGPLTTADDTAIERVLQAAATVKDVTSVRDQGVSADGHARRALLITVPDGPGNTSNSGLVSAVRATFTSASPPAGLTFHLTGPLAQTTDADTAATKAGSNIHRFTLLFVIVLLFVVYRSLLAPVITLIPAVLALLLAGPVIGQAGEAGLPVSPAIQQLLVVLLLGAGTDYGLFLVFRMREEIRRGRHPREALIAAMGRVGESITFSAVTVIAALACLALATFGLYRGLGPALAIALVVMLLAALTLLPALLAIAGRALFWPTRPADGQQTVGVWGRIGARAVRRPIPVLAAGILLFGGLAAGLNGFTTGGFTSGKPATAGDSADGAAVLAAHFPAPTNNGETVLLRFADPVWHNPNALQTAQQQLAAAATISALTGPLNPNGTTITAADLADLHTRLGSGTRLSPTPPTGISPSLYQAYRASTQFISTDGRTVRFDAVPAAGPAGSRAAIDAVPMLRATVTEVATSVAATDNGVAGLDATAHDIYTASTSDLIRLVPIVLLVILLLLAVLLRSLIAPLYLIVTVGLSYVAALGFAGIVFVHYGNGDGLNFIIPILLFIFAMALGEDYNILLMARVREEAHTYPLREALTRAIGHTGGTITAAGLILAGTFAVLAIAGDSDQARQLGFTIAFAVILDTFFVRTLLVPAAAVLLGRYNWWPSALSRIPADHQPTTAPDPTADNTADPAQPATTGGTP
ncbi:MMPL family transporter [Acrocarpospora catenulata]|uniref:MMPL family transporter n=1 Tax=Acrocarpospora catenulata TaxID=2836182 RepID=UPI001BDB6C60|nr:MMPL family transporter [Acrocarpospora catenulata]